jgi:hypothetical protein
MKFYEIIAIIVQMCTTILFAAAIICNTQLSFVILSHHLLDGLLLLQQVV